jgi:drug/metabolite transporter (DMT)-like permease
LTTPAAAPAASADAARAAHRRALAAMALSALSFGVMAFAVKLAARGLPAAEITLVRFALMLVPLAWPPVLARALDWRRKDLLLYRGVFGGVAVLLYFLAIEHVPVGVATLLNYSSPIWAVPLAALALGERVRPALLVPFAVALVGMGLVTGALEPGGFARLGVWEAAGLASSVLSAAAVVSIRAARRTEGSWAIYSSFTVCGLLVALPFAWRGLRWPSAGEWALLALVGAASIAAQLAMTYAYRWLTNLQAGVFAQLTVVCAMGLGVVVLGEPFGPWKLAGSGLALAGVLGVVRLGSPPRAVE